MCSADTQFTAFFKLNENAEDVWQYAYSDIPCLYVYDKRIGMWKRRVRGAGKIISWLYTVHPNEAERFHLRILLLHIRGPTSFEALRTHNGVVYKSYKSAAAARNLLDTYDKWEQCMLEAVEVRMPSQLRELFAVLCALNMPSHPLTLFEQFEQHLIENYVTAGNTQEEARNKNPVYY